MPDVLQTKESAPVIESSQLLGEKIAALRRRHVMVLAMTGLAMAVVVGIELLALAMFLDWWLELPWVVRLVSLLVQLGAFAYILSRFVLVPILRQPEEDELALMIEKARPEFRSRLIAAVQLARPGAVPPGASSALAIATVAETEALAGPFDFRQIVPTDRLKKFGVMAVMVPLLGLMGFVAGRETCTDLLK